MLNGKPIFMHGVLDQGYWPEGIYTPPSREAYEQDILAMKNLGFNMLRKHVKVEAPYYYYLCDKLGMMVCQDMVQNGSYSYIRDTALPNLSLKRRKDTRNVKGDESRRKIFISVLIRIRQTRSLTEAATILQRAQTSRTLQFSRTMTSSLWVKESLL